ncbi:MAG: aminopeptidase N [Legionella sp.]|nr:aminopeptidase N [Legionella sp.]
MPDTTIYLKDYKAPNFEIKSVNLKFALYETYVIVTSTQRLVRRMPGPLWLCGDELELICIEFDGVRLELSSYSLKENGLILESCPDDFRLEVTTRIYPHLNTKLSGLYRSNQLFCTQCEAEGFRRITYFLDRPDVLTIFETRISADKKLYPVLLSNGNLVETGESPDGRHWAVWQDPFKKPAYLFALVAGNLACVQDSFKTASGRLVDLRVYVEQGNETKCQHALDSLKKAMSWDEAMYGREYDLDVYMIVAVSDFNMGAMENKGLNIFNSKYILAKPEEATDQDFIDIESVVGHEYFHNWTGNRVTCRDWFQLSLKEGLTVFRDQSFSEDMNSADVFRISDVKALRSSQFPEDAGAMAHPVRPESYREINNFYTATIYNKGAEVIRMQHALLGKDGFRKGMDLYFERHDGQAVTIDDFVAAMADANARDLTQFKRWYSQAGTPEVQVKSEYLHNRLTLTLQQSCPQTPDGKEKKPFHIPIKFALFDSNGQQMSIAHDVIELTEKKQDFIFDDLNEKPMVSLLRGFSAPIYLQEKRTQDELLFLLGHETDGYAKWDAGQRLVTNHLNGCLRMHLKTVQIPEALIDAFEHILQDEALDDYLRAELITPPGFEEVALHLKSIDVDALEAVRKSYRHQLGHLLQKPLLTLYKKLWDTEDHLMNGKGYGRRKLRNTALWLLMKSDEAANLDLCSQQFASAKTMTDQMAAFTLLVNCSNKTVQTAAIESFHKQWHKNDLVMDKWFSAQAASELPNTLDKVKQLMEHPLFSMTNPNKVRALIGSFCVGNPDKFHALDGSGYVFLGDMLRSLDKINPQVAARLANPFTRWPRFDKPRRLLMWKQLEQLAQSELSRDLRELVDKSMDIEKN